MTKCREDPVAVSVSWFYRTNPAPWCSRTGVILGYSVSRQRQSMAVFVENRSRSRIQSTSLSHDHGIHLLHGPSHVNVQDVQVLPTHLEQALAHHFPFIGSSLHSHCFRSRL